MTFKFSLTAVLLTGLMLGSTVASVSANDQDEIVPVTLGHIQSFEVENFHGNFPTGHPADGEIAEYVRSTILENKVLPYQSPGQGVLHFDCGGMKCNKIKVSLTIGEDGPVVWRSEKLTRLGLYNFERNRRKIAQQVVEELETAYQGSIKVNPEKINIEVD